MMLTVKKLPKEKLQELIPLYLEYTADYMRTGKRIPSELNPIHILSVNINQLSIKEQEKLLSKIEYNIEILKSILGELSFLN